MFNFYFQSGEFIGSSGDFWGPFLGAASPVIIFLIQQRYDKRKNKNLRSSFEIDKLKYLTYLIVGSGEFLQNTIEQLKNSIDLLNNDLLRFDAFLLHPADDLIRIVHKIDQENFYHSYVNKFPGGHNEVSLLFHTLDKVNQERKNIEFILNTASETNRKKGLEITLGFSKIINELRVISDKGVVSTEVNNILHKHLNSFSEKMKIHGNGYRIIDKYLIQPIGEYIDLIIHVNPELNELYSLTKETSLDIIQLANDNKDTKNKLLKISNILQDARQVFIDNSKTIDSQFGTDKI